MRPKYLFIRILEACNADCFMCGFALSRETYRFSPQDLARLLPNATRSGVRFVRFTGGETLMHGEIAELVETAVAHGMRTSLITNGMLLPKKAARLAEAGLSQVIVSLDGASASTHDFYRNSPGCFDNAMAGLVDMRDLGVLTRVNSVVGPHNYREVPAMQREFSRLGVRRWELSALKLAREVLYEDPDDVVRVCEPVYTPADPTLLVPLGKRFYGDTEDERHRFFVDAITPRASGPTCRATDDVIFYDPKAGSAYACSLLAYAADGAPINVEAREGRAVPLETPTFRAHREYFRDRGPRNCRNCSATAAGYSDDVQRQEFLPEWQY
ncbi:cytosylglucuronate decarboxylase [Actinophytocola xinjiangensis]|uniref:Cytosylglucuronate decarboxylase n=1 Tax=Actinophytocola xinjiangensis TaxID=485602 RepID=A0A7Z0WUG3_9PSEU|nr:cytosylglucuronate decarboxylase [Actinophytocola xinjiangensis]OLF14256.1 cytosylglucuronate decarboxylase [Actinophytocola xinjiangensis]